MEANLIYLSDQELSVVEGGTWISWVLGYSWEAFKDFITPDNAEQTLMSETLMNCI
jgi:hypothetical protein